MKKRASMPVVIIAIKKEKPKMKSAKIVTFGLPKGFVPPEGVVEGDTFEALATFRHGGNKLDLVAIEGAEMEKEEPEMENAGGEEMASKAPAEAGFAEAIEMASAPEKMA